MDNKVQLQPAYVLHRQPFQNTSLLLDFFSLDYGRVKTVAKGARREKSKYRPFIHPFQPLLISFSGRGEVKTLVGVETSVRAFQLQGTRLFSGLYINELLTRLLHNHVEHKALYSLYQQTLVSLQGESSLELALRRFELSLLSELGYGLNLETDCGSDAPIVPHGLYRYLPNLGFTVLPRSHSYVEGIHCISGVHILAIKNMQLEDPETATAAKKLLRAALAVQLGDKPLASRGLFSQMG